MGPFSLKDKASQVLLLSYLIAGRIPALAESTKMAQGNPRGPIYTRKKRFDEERDDIDGAVAKIDG
jgi:hypothetical protein